MDITKLMLREHGIILGLVNKLKKSKSESDFAKLKAKQDNHVFAEERAIFILDKDGKRFPEIITILNQHEELTKFEDAIRDNLIHQKDFSKELASLGELMKVHIQFEDKKFYPKLDKYLDNTEKEEIMKKLQDVILGNIRL